MTIERRPPSVKVLDAAGKDISCQVAAEDDLRALLDRLAAAGWTHDEVASAAVELVNAWYLSKAKKASGRVE
jgi:hypothetical protein